MTYASEDCFSKVGLLVHVHVLRAGSSLSGFATPRRPRWMHTRRWCRRDGAKFRVPRPLR